MELTILKIAAYLGAGLCVGIASVTSGIGTGMIADQATIALMRQPRANDRMFSSMLIGQAATGTGGIFSLVVALLLLYGGFIAEGSDWTKAAALLAAGLATGIGAIGPALGAGYTGSMACKSIGRNPKQSSILMGNMLIGQALAQASSIFALVVSLLLLFSTPRAMEGAEVARIIVKCSAYIGAGLAIGFGTIGPGAGIGYVAGRACDMLGRFPKQRSSIIRTMFLGAAVSESTAIYSL
ncbi:MAG: ATP synthase F0 subunit C, partial [Candidatus Cloacimonetes bacterium]|nr:ATP synthase F0 subunit C [Candidatus Cloacimonadota bacterium]